MSRPKYLVYPGNIKSFNDMDIHYISAKQIIDLYKVNPRECIIVTDERKTRGLRGKFVVLQPDYYGKYDLNDCKEVNL